MRFPLILRSHVASTAVRFTLWLGLIAILLGVSSCAFSRAPSPPGNAVVLLSASNAVVHGTMLRYEPQTNKNCLGYWTKAEDWADWTFDVARAGSFEVEVWQGCGKDNGGSEVAVEVGGKRFDFVVEDTGHFQNFTPRRIGRVELPAGKHVLAVKPQRKQGAAVMDVRRVRLLPVNPLPAPAAGAMSRWRWAAGDSTSWSRTRDISKTSRRAGLVAWSCPLASICSR